MNRVGATAGLLLPLMGCTTVDPGTNFVVADQTFDADFYYCHVEPALVFAKNCGPGDPTMGDRPNGCHFNQTAVTSMVLLEHPAVDCGGGDHPLSSAQTGTGSAAAGNFDAVSLEMSRDYPNAPLLVRPAGNNHPRAVISRADPKILQLLAQWASR